jgi:hypothetical protein
METHQLQVSKNEDNFNNDLLINNNNKTSKYSIKLKGEWK